MSNELLTQKLRNLRHGMFFDTDKTNAVDVVNGLLDECIALSEKEQREDTAVVEELVKAADRVAYLLVNKALPAAGYTGVITRAIAALDAAKAKFTNKEAYRQAAKKPDPLSQLKEGNADCPACGSPMELDLRKRLQSRRDNYAPIIWRCACGLTLTLHGSR